jgi:hypothetical protein
MTNFATLPSPKSRLPTSTIIFTLDRTFHPRHALQRTFFSQSPSLRSRRCSSTRQVHPFSSRPENAGGCGGAGWGVFALYIDLGDDLASVSRPIYILATPALSPSLSQISFASLLRSRTRIVALLVAVAESEKSIQYHNGSPVTFSAGIHVLSFLEDFSVRHSRISTIGIDQSQPTSCFLANFTSSLIDLIPQASSLSTTAKAPQRPWNFSPGSFLRLARLFAPGHHFLPQDLVDH